MKNFHINRNYQRKTLCRKRAGRGSRRWMCEQQQWARRSRLAAQTHSRGRRKMCDPGLTLKPSLHTQIFVWSFKDRPKCPHNSEMSSQCWLRAEVGLYKVSNTRTQTHTVSGFAAVSNKPNPRPSPAGTQPKLQYISHTKWTNISTHTHAHWDVPRHTLGHSPRSLRAFTQFATAWKDKRSKRNRKKIYEDGPHFILTGF